MKRLAIASLVGGVLVAAAALSGHQVGPAPAPTGPLQVQSEERNPWTNLRLNNDSETFRFAVVSDRTGGHRAQVFSQAVERLNLMQPEFVLSVGDLIEGYNKDKDKVAQQWREFQGYVSQLQMPFFYVPGNHDVSNPEQERLWQEKFGRRYYHFVYKNVLFLLLCADDPSSKLGQIGEEQIAWVKKTLEAYKAVRWTIVALHRPMWTQPELDKNGWLDVEKALEGRPYTVFAGHIHVYRKFVRQGMNYYQLATTGGASRMRGVRYGEFDHFVWVTMKKDGPPLLANVMLDGVYPEDLRRSPTDEGGVLLANRRPTYPVRGKVFFDGCPVPNAQVVFHYFAPAEKTYQHAGDALTEADGSFVLSTYTAGDGAPVGQYAVTVVAPEPLLDPQGKPGPNRLPERYAKPDTSGLRVQVRDVANDFTLELKK